MSIDNLKKLVRFNQKWYLTLFLGVISSMVWNGINSYKQHSYEKSNDIEFAQLRKENNLLKYENAYLIAENLKNYSNIDKMPKAAWSKKKSGDKFIYSYYNRTFWKQFLKPLGHGRFYMYNKTDFDLFSFKDATAFYKEDSLAVLRMRPRHINRDFINVATNEKIKDGYVKWGEYVNWGEDNYGDKYSWGVMDNFFEEEDSLK